MRSLIPWTYRSITRLGLLGSFIWLEACMTEARMEMRPLVSGDVFTERLGARHHLPRFQGERKGQSRDQIRFLCLALYVFWTSGQHFVLASKRKDESAPRLSTLATFCRRVGHAPAEQPMSKVATLCAHRGDCPCPAAPDECRGRFYCSWTHLVPCAAPVEK